MIYLGGPYSSDSLYQHKTNVGKLLAYKIWIWHESKPDMPIICWPLETSGFDKINKLDKINWLDYALKIAKSASVGFFVPGSEDSYGCSIEMNMLDSLGIPHKILSEMTLEDKIYLENLISESTIWNENLNFALLYLRKRS